MGYLSICQPFDVCHVPSSHFSARRVKSGEHPKCCRKTRGYRKVPLLTRLPAYPGAVPGTVRTCLRAVGPPQVASLVRFGPDGEGHLATIDVDNCTMGGSRWRRTPRSLQTSPTKVRDGALRHLCH